MSSFGETSVARTRQPESSSMRWRPCTWPGDPAADRDHPAVDLGVDLARLADDQGVVGDDPALDAAVHPHDVAEAQLPGELGALVEEPVQVLGREALHLQHPAQA